MWNYEKRLQYPINITTPNAKIAQIIMSQYGGPDGEMGASMRYLSQRYSMPDRRVCGVLTDIGTEELAHLEMVASIVRKLTKGLSAEELEAAGFAPYYVDHTGGIWPQAAGGIPFNACEFQSKGDALTDLFEDMAAEQKARELKVENQQLQQKIPSMKEKLKEAQERQRLENENRQLKVQVEYLEKDLSWERGISARLQEGIGAVLDFLDRHLPEQFRPLVEKARELLPVPEVQQPEREQERGHTWGGMEL